MDLKTSTILLGKNFQDYTYTIDKRPNIVFIMADDHAFQALSAYSDELNEKYLKSYLEHMARRRR